MIIKTWLHFLQNIFLSEIHAIQQKIILFYFLKLGSNQINDKGATVIMEALYAL